MKQVSHSAGSFVTGNAAAEALLEFAVSVTGNARSAAVDITVLEEDGRITQRSLLVSPGSQFEVIELPDASPTDEASRFPVPSFPTLDYEVTPEPREQLEHNTRVYEKAVSDMESA